MDKLYSEPIRFRSVRKEHGWMSNMSAYGLRLNGEFWSTGEHAFQANRFEIGHPIREEIKQENSPMSAKTIAKKHVAEMQIVPRSDEDVALMNRVVHAKLTHNTKLVEMLLETSSPIIEDTTFRKPYQDMFWGAALIEGKWLGLNHLGEILMKYRDYYSSIPQIFESDDND
jgi:ribA/ribD-fused uncharacterized protein